MNDSNLKHKKKLASTFEAVFDAPTGEREKLLSSLCGNDSTFRREVEGMLHSVGSLDGFMEKPLAKEAIQALKQNVSDNFLGQRIGKYILRSVIGQGGMGTVFLGERVDDFEHRVAIKIISPLTTSDTDTEIFKRERQILARLEHPAISRLLDAGKEKSGMPYIIMEYVKGISLISYCSEKNLSLEKRLDLFTEVCEAVKFAHQNLIIHRDLKPTNILVTEEGNPKLLDFGIAKMLHSKPLERLSEISITTKILTPNYASPEQLKGEAITTASDVYSLGVILYQMLTGSRPHDLTCKPLPEIIQAISEETPEKPHIKALSKQDDPSQEASSTKNKDSITGIEPKLLKGDLDTIILKALEKDVKDRYQTVEQLTDDIYRYCNNLPILAKPPSAIYKFKKFAVRNRLPFASVCIALLFGIMLVATSVWFARASAEQALDYRRQAYSSDMNLAMQSYETANIIRVKQILEQYGDFRFKGWEYDFLKRLVNPPSKIASLKHSSEVWNVAFSPDGKLLATACADGFARIYEVPSGKLVTKTVVQERNVWKVVFSPDSDFLAAASGDSESASAKIWNAKTGKEVFSLKGHTDRVRAIDYSPDGKTIATGSRDGTIKIWDTETGEMARTIELPKASSEAIETHDLAFSPDGLKLLSGQESYASIYDFTRNKLEIFQKDKTRFLSVAFSPDGEKFALAGHDSRIEIYDSNSLKLIEKITANDASINDISFSRNGEVLASASRDRTIRFFKTEGASEIKNLRSHAADVWSVAFSPDGNYLASGSTDFTAQLFDQKKLIAPNSFGEQSGFSRQWSAISLDRKTVATTESLESKIYQVVYDLTQFKTGFKFSEDVVNAGAFSPNSEFLATLLFDGSIVIWNTKNWTETIRFKAHTKPKGRRSSGRTITYSREGKFIVSGGFDSLVKIWDSSSGKLIRVLHKFENRVSVVGVSSDNSRVFAASYDSTAKLFEAETGKLIADLGQQPKPILSVVYAPDGKTFVTGGADGSIKTWNLEDGKHLKTYSGNAGFIWQLAFSPDGRRLVSASSEGVIRFWDTESDLAVLYIRTDSAVTNLLAFSPDGKTLISHGTNERIRRWESEVR